jgi:predicted transcriptional regulator
MNSDFKFSKELIQLRRAKVLELAAQAIPQNEIAQKLGVSPATVSLDMQYLREAAMSNIQNHIEERIPMQYEECHTGLRLILRKTYDIINSSTKPKEVLSAMGLAVDIYGKLLDLSTNGAILEKTINHIKQLKEQAAQSQVNNKQPDTLTAYSAEDEEEEDLQQEE